jgi:hypothetical protein
MTFNTVKVLRKQKKQIPKLWMKNQLVDFSPREELMYECLVMNCPFTRKN